MPPSTGAPITWDGELPRLAVERFTLASGLEVVVHTDRASPMVAVWMGYRVGSSDEGDGDSGFAHLFEHMFKNSLHLGGRHHYQILREAGAIDANAQTGTDRTVYHETVPQPALATALWLEADRMGYFLPALDDERLRAQIAVVRSERRQRYENAPYGPERFAVAEALYPEGHPLRYLTIGRHQDIAAATVARCAQFYRTWYVPANATLVLAGDVDAAEAEAACARWFGSFPPSVRPSRRTWPTPIVTGRPRQVVGDPLAALGRVRRAWIGPVADSDDAAALEALAIAWALPGSGRLWRALVHERRWAQRVGVGVTAGRLGGEVHVTVDLAPGADPAAVGAILDQALAAVHAGDVDPRAVARATRRREAALLWRLDGLARRASLLLTAELTSGGPDGIALAIARARRVDAAAVAAAARRWLDPDRMVEVVTEPRRLVASA
jgi:zinc protease